MKKMIICTLLIVYLSCDNSITSSGNSNNVSWTMSNYWSDYDWNSLLNYAGGYKLIYNGAYMGYYPSVYLYDKSKAIHRLSIPNAKIKIITSMLPGQSVKDPDTTTVEYDNKGRISKLKDTEYFYSSTNKIDSIVYTYKTINYKYSNDLISCYYSTTDTGTTDSSVFFYNGNTFYIKKYERDTNSELVLDDSTAYEVHPKLNFITRQENWTYDSFTNQWNLSQYYQVTITDYFDNGLLKSVDVDGNKEYYLYNDESKVDSVYTNYSDNYNFEYGENGNITYMEKIGKNRKTYTYDEKSGLPKKYVEQNFNFSDSSWYDAIILEVQY